MERKIGFISKNFYSGGGIELFEIAVAEKLAQRGWDVAAVYQNDGDLRPQWQKFAQVQQQDLSASSARQALANFFMGCNILYAHRPGDFATAFHVSRMVKAPVAIHLHVPPWHLREGWKRFILGPHNETMDPQVFSKRSAVDRFLAVSHHTANSWVKSGIPKQKIEVIHNGVDTDKYRPKPTNEKQQIRQSLGIEPDSVVIGYVGRIDEAKGIQQLLQAFQIIAAKTKIPLALLVIGEATRSLGTQGVQLTEQLQQYATDNIHWLGKRQDVDQLYRAMDVLVVPSQWDEPFGLVAIEGLASQLPVLATKSGGLKEILAGTIDENLVGKSPEAIANRLLELVEDEELRIRLGLKGRDLACNRFNLENTVNQIEKQLLDLVSSKLLPAYAQ